MDLISVIVPVYKVEPFLNKCIESIVGQTYKNLEIILVDDGSPDKCGIMCDEWAMKDGRIKVIHKKNGGLSDARNAGIKVAAGDYIGFVDSDDWLEIDMFEILMKNLVKYNAQISGIGFYKTVNENMFQNNENEIINVFDVNEAMKALIENKISAVVWNKIYKKEIIDNIFFEIGKLHEDEFWSYHVFGKSKKIVMSDIKKYYYRQRPDSIMGIMYNENRLDALEAKMDRLDYLQNHFPQLVINAKIDMFFSCIYHGQLSLISLNKNITTLEKIKKMAFNVDISNDDLKNMSWIQFFWIKASYFNFKLVCKIRNKFKIGL